jgi:hypothetical protein
LTLIRASLLDFDRRNFYLSDEGRITAQVRVTRIAGFDGGNFAVAEQPEKIPQQPAGERHIVGGEKQLDPILGRVDLVFVI